MFNDEGLYPKVKKNSISPPFPGKMVSSHLFERGLLTHELSKGQLAVKVSIHVCEKFLNLSPAW